MKTNHKIDAARIDLLLRELRLSGIRLYLSCSSPRPPTRKVARRSLPRRSRRTGDGRAKQTSLRAESRASAAASWKDPRHVRVRRRAMISKAQVKALAGGDAWLENGANLLCFGPPGGRKSYLAASLGFALIENGWRVLFTRTTDLVQKLQIARRDLVLEAAIAKLDKYHRLILDDLAYVSKDQAETSVLFELISTRYERRSLLITANQPFGEWGRIFPGQAMTLAAWIASFIM
jgi:DNA replication protein DnaC